LKIVPYSSQNRHLRKRPSRHPLKNIFRTICPVVSRLYRFCRFRVQAAVQALGHRFRSLVRPRRRAIRSAEGPAARPVLRPCPAASGRCSGSRTAACRAAVSSGHLSSTVCRSQSGTVRGSVYRAPRGGGAMPLRHEAIAGDY